LPKGTSDYQAAWLVGDEDDDEDSDDAVSDAPGDDNAASEEEMHAVQDDDGDDDEMGGMEAAMQAINFDDVEAERERRRQEEEADSFEFPDEIDTPLETPARVRFARYRGLKSFRSSHWDPKESLPLDYAKIFELESYAMARDRVIAEPACGQVAQPGQYITVVLEGVDVEAATALQARVVRPTGTPDPIVAVGLLPHENQMSVMHVLVQRFDEYEAPVKSKEPMVAHVGFRRFCARPIFSDHNINSDKSKMQRYMQHGFVVATIYAPITFAPNCPALLFTPAGGAVSPLRDARSVDMVAMGSLLSVDPNRIVLKRTILSGFPYKIHKTRAVVRYMFFNAGDIEWFKPIELQTKLGRTGHIRQSIGTHGYMKCQFNGQLRGNDTICLHLYKRQFPPAWDTEWFS
jgi:pre-rRNA-processing protein TSR1